MPDMLTFRDLTLGYDRHPAVHHLEGKVVKGAMLAIVGPNGGGKSTLLKAISGKISPLAGSLGNSFPSLAYMPQIGDLTRDFPISVLDLAMTGQCRQRGLFGGFSRKDRERTRLALEAVGLGGFEGRAIRTLSGGQLQRLLFARLMVQDAALILLDEPFAAIDTRTTQDLVTIIEDWHKEGRTIVAVLHDMPLVRAHFPETLLLAREQIAWGATERVLTEENLAEARRMGEAFDENAAECRRVA